MATPLGPLPGPEQTVEPMLRQLEASWTIASDAAAVVDYEVSWIQLSLFEVQQHTPYAEAQTATLSPARAGKTYIVQVRSRDLNRVSEWSPVQEVTVWQLPGAVLIADTTPDYRELRYAVSIAAGAVSSPAADQVEAAYYISSQQNWTKRTLALGAGVKVITNLTAGATYELRVRVFSQAGSIPGARLQRLTVTYTSPRRPYLRQLRLSGPIAWRAVPP